MVHKILISAKVPDPRQNILLNKLQGLGFKKNCHKVEIIDVYSIKKNLNQKQLIFCADMLANPVVQEYDIDTINGKISFDWAIEVGFLPGVTDNVGSTATEMISDGLRIKFTEIDHIYTSRIYCLIGKFSQNEIQKIADTLYNPIIERAMVADKLSFNRLILNPQNIPEVKLKTIQTVKKVNLNISDEELTQIGKSGIVNSDGSLRGPLALNLAYMKAIQKYFSDLGRSPTDIELESLAQTWSEHCKHTIFSDPIDEDKEGLFKTYIERATNEIRKQKGKKDFCASVFTDNSGAIKFDNEYLITHKVETHNSPSALDPFGGSVTGIVGVNRDTIGFGMGAKPIANTYGFCFADPNDREPIYRDKLKNQPMLSPRRILDGVVSGVNSGGNCSGIPTPQGFVYFDNCYKGKPLVFVGTIGLILQKVNGMNLIQKKAGPGDYIVMVGGRVGLDGIHGATFSSEALTGSSPATAVQIGDPITQKKLSDALIKEARDLNLYSSITDNGAGGLSCSVAEMAKESNGCLVNLDKVPLKYPGLSPWQIWISESQERMTLAVPPRKWKKLFKLLKQRGVEASVIGKFTNSAKCIVKASGKTVMNIDMNFLHHGLPPNHLYSSYTRSVNPDPTLPDDSDLTNILEKMTSRKNIAGYGFIFSQFDHEVQSSSVLKPLQGRGRVNADTTVIKPVFDSMQGIALSQGIYPSYSEIDTYQMAACSIDTAIRNLVAAGANMDKIALLDNFCWCSSTDHERLGQLKAAACACYDTATFYQTPFISGKDSMFNDFSGFNRIGQNVNMSILPTLLISAIGIIQDIRKSVSLDFKMAGDLIYILGNTFTEVGASEFYAFLSKQNGENKIGNKVPQVVFKDNRKIYRALSKCINKGLIVSAISCGRGGLAIALIKSSIGGQLGINIDLSKLPGKIDRSDMALFSESQGRVLVSINPKFQREFEKYIKNIPSALLGHVIDKPNFLVNGLSGQPVIKTDIRKLNSQYKSVFSGY
jgi:phosphoribosylformylglycinamidine synthase subunit PurSL